MLRPAGNARPIRAHSGRRPVALDTLLAQHRSVIRRLVSARLDPNLRPRPDESDVVQETQPDLARHIDDFLRRNPMPFHLWVGRRLTRIWLRQREWFHGR